MDRFIRLALTASVTYTLVRFREFTIPALGWSALLVLAINWINVAFRETQIVFPLNGMDFVEDLGDMDCDEPDCASCELKRRAD